MFIVLHECARFDKAIFIGEGLDLHQEHYYPVFC